VGCTLYVQMKVAPVAAVSYTQSTKS